MLSNPLWLNAFAASATAFLIAVIATPIVRKYALRWKLGDKPNGRKINTDLIPHLGGIALVLGTLGGAVVFGVLAGRGDGGAGTWLGLWQKMLLPVAMIVVLGLIDDMKNLRAMEKLAVQILSAVILVFSGFSLLVGVPLIDGVQIVAAFVTVAFLVGISSSVNLIDGHDGQAAGISLISALAFAALGVVLDAPMVIAMTLTLTGACLGFLVFNFPPGKIYMGDTGSMFLGIVLGIIACTVTALQPTVNTFVAICFVLGVPLLDSLLAVTRRVALRAPVFRADSLHMHHVLRGFGLSHRQVLAVMLSMHAFLAILGILAAKGMVISMVLGLAFIVVVYATFLRVMVVSRLVTERIPTKLTPNSIPSLEK